MVLGFPNSAQLTTYRYTGKPRRSKVGVADRSGGGGGGLAASGRGNILVLRRLENCLIPNRLGVINPSKGSN